MFFHFHAFFCKKIDQIIDYPPPPDPIQLGVLNQPLTAADPGFPRGGANSPGGRQHTILPNFPENCMKSKEFGRPGGGAPCALPLNPPLTKDVLFATLFDLNVKLIEIKYRDKYKLRSSAAGGNSACGCCAKGWIQVKVLTSLSYDGETTRVVLKLKRVRLFRGLQGARQVVVY